MPTEFGEENGFMTFSRDANDKMGFEGMAELYLCLAEQAPDWSRQDPDWDMVKKIVKILMQDGMSLSQIEYMFSQEITRDLI